MGMLGAGLGLGMVVGPVIAGAVSQFGSAAPPLCAAALALGDLVLAFFLMPETRPDGTAPNPASGPGSPRPSLLSVVQEPRMAAVFGLSFLTFISMSNLQVAMPLLAKQRLGWEARENGYGFAIFGLIMMLIQGGLLGRLARALGELRLIIAGAALMTAGMLLVATAYQTAGLLCRDHSHRHRNGGDKPFAHQLGLAPVPRRSDGGRAGLRAVRGRVGAHHRTYLEWVTLRLAGRWGTLWQRCGCLAALPEHRPRAVRGDPWEPAGEPVMVGGASTARFPGQAGGRIG